MRGQTQTKGKRKAIQRGILKQRKTCWSNGTRFSGSRRGMQR